MAFLFADPVHPGTSSLTRGFYLGHLGLRGQFPVNPPLGTTRGKLRERDPVHPVDPGKPRALPLPRARDLWPLPGRRRRAVVGVRAVPLGQPPEYDLSRNHAHCRRGLRERGAAYQIAGPSKGAERR